MTVRDMAVISRPNVATTVGPGMAILKGPGMCVAVTPDISTAFVAVGGLREVAHPVQDVVNIKPPDFNEEGGIFSLLPAALTKPVPI